MQRIARMLLKPGFYAVLLMWLVVFDWFGSGVPTVQYLIRAAYGLIFLRLLILRFNERATLLVPKAVIPLALIFIQHVISVPASPLPLHGVEVVLGYLLIIMAWLYLFDELQSELEPRTLENTMISMAIVFSLLNLVDVLSWFILWWRNTGAVLSMPPFGFRLEGVFLHHPNVEIAFLNLVLPLVVVRLLQERRNAHRFLWLLLLGLIGLVDYFSSSRGGWLAAVCGLSVTLSLLNLPAISRLKDRGLHQLRDVFRSRRQYLLASIAVIVVIVVGLAFLGQLRSTSHAPVASARSKIWRTSWNIFTKSPIVGNGAGSMHILPAIEDQLPPGFFLVHAHNVLLQIAAESGVVGLALVLLATGLGFKAFIKSWGSADDRARTDLAVYAGIWVGVGVHNLVDVAFEAPIYILCTGVFLALIYRHAPDEEKLKLNRRRMLSVVAFLLVVFIVGSLYALRGSDAHFRGLQQAGKNDWDGASASVCEAVALNPDNSFFYFQCGLAKAHLFQISDDETTLESAISNIEAGLQIDPHWPVHWANLSVLKWEAGESAEALECMLQAVNAAPRNAVFALNLGRMYESLGQNETAILAYQQALYNDPWMGNSLFFNASPVRSELIQQPQTQVSSPPRRQAAWEGWVLLSAGQTQQAKEAFRRALQSKPDYGLAYAGLALVGEVDGLAQQARLHADNAIFADVDTPLVFIIAGQIAERQGRSEDATALLLSAYLNIKHNSYSTHYYGSVYRRWSFTMDIVPQMETAFLSQEMVTSFYDLVEKLQALGQEDVAQQILEWIVRSSS